MDLVHIFNDELHSLLASRPPVSKAKMGLITKAAMKGVKFYKHIVQCVEKFIARCRPEYKLAGLYVIDSIVRQSRHQFGPERDLFAARFARNLGITFENLFGDCSPEDKSRMVRVLNLWLKNEVFDMRIIRPLLDMATPNAAVSCIGDPKSPYSGDTSGGSAALAQQLSARYNSLPPMGDATPTTEKRGRLDFRTTMLDFDYGEDDEAEDADETPTEAEPPLRSTLSKLEMEQQPQRNSINTAKKSMMMMNHRGSPQEIRSAGSPTPSSHHSQNPSQQIHNKPPDHDRVLERWNRILKGDLSTCDQLTSHTTSDTTAANAHNNHNQIQRRSRSKSPTARIVHSSHRDQAADLRRHYKESGDFHMSGASKRDSERERKCLPRLRDRHLTVCSSTLWLGHVPKSVTEADISNAFGEFGAINSIDLIPPRGCAYVCMDRRQDAKRALNRSKHLKLNGSHIKMAWAPGKGLKEQKRLKDFWESDIGASFIPFAKVDDSLDLDALEEGGVIDEDSMSLDMREKRDNKARERDRETSHSTDSAQVQSTSSGNEMPAAKGPGLTLADKIGPSAGVLPFIIPPTPLHLGIPPPLLLGQQSIVPFPPGSGLNSSGHITLPPTSSSAHGSSEPRDLEPLLGSATEQKLCTVDQQFSVLAQQAQGLVQGQPPILFNPNLPDPMVFDFRGQLQPQMMMLHPGMMDLQQHQQHHQQVVMFDAHAHPMLIGQHPQMMPFDQQANMVDLSGSTDESYVAQRQGEY